MTVHQRIYSGDGVGEYLGTVCWLGNTWIVMGWAIIALIDDRYGFGDDEDFQRRIQMNLETVVYCASRAADPSCDEDLMLLKKEQKDVVEAWGWTPLSAEDVRLAHELVFVTDKHDELVTDSQTRESPPSGGGLPRDRKD